MNTNNGKRKKVFVNDRLDHHFENDGYLIINLLDEHELKALDALYAKLDPKVKRGFYTSLWSPDKEYRLAAANEITQIIGSKVKSLFVEHSPLFGDFIVKRPNMDSEIGQHQDWKFVDEPEYCSINVWCPLVDVSQKNGGIELIKRSHLFYQGPRGANIPPPFHNLTGYIDENYLVPANLKRGQAAIFTHRIIHGSKSNLSPADRVVANTVMVPDSAQVYHYHKKADSNVIEKIKVPRDYYLNYNYNKDFIEKIEVGNITRPPGGEVVEEIPFVNKATTPEEFDKLYAKYNPEASEVYVDYV